MFVFSLLDCCALIFLSVYFVSLPEAGGGRPGALRPRDRAGVGPVLGPGQGRGNEGGGRRRARVAWELARLEASLGWRRAPVAQLCPSPGGPSGPYSRSARARPARRLLPPATPGPALPCASPGTWPFLVAFGGEGRGLLPFWPSREKDHGLSCSCPGPGPSPDARGPESEGPRPGGGLSWTVPR